MTKYFNVLHYNYRTKDITIQLTDKHAFLEEVERNDNYSGSSYRESIPLIDLSFIGSKGKIITFKKCKVIREVCGFSHSPNTENALILKGTKGK